MDGLLSKPVPQEGAFPREPKGVAHGIFLVLLSQDLGQSSPNPRVPQMAEHTAQQLQELKRRAAPASWPTTSLNGLQSKIQGQQES